MSQITTTDSTDPSILKGLTREITAADLGSHSVIGRKVFGIALARVAPEFWESLDRQVAQRLHGGVSQTPSLIRAEMESWAAENGVVDQWLLDTCLQTLIGWINNPGRDRIPQYIPEGPVILHFNPCFTDARPMVTGYRPGATFAEKRLHDLFAEPAERESLEDFKRRMKKQFNAHIARYSRYYTNRINDNDKCFYRNAVMAAMRFRGKSYGEIARVMLKSARLKERRTTKEAIKRFSTLIGLTLPKGEHEND